MCCLHPDYMPSVKISHCVICDGVRPELSNKLTLLGFFGITPNVEVRLGTVSLPVDELTFILIGSVSGSAGSAEVAFELFDWSDSSIFSVSKSHDIKPVERSNFIFNVRSLKFPHTGRYKIRMRVDGRVIYNTDFLISEGPAQLPN